MTEPTDAELDELRQANSGRLNFVTFSEFRTIARAVLAKWGTPPAAAGEPAAYLHDDGCWTAAKTDVGRSLNDRLLFAGSPKVAVYATPQPTQAQAGAVPLTDIRKAALDLYTPPFRHEYGYIRDANHQMVADDASSEATGLIAARIRGWGRIQYMDKPEMRANALQDEVAEMVAEALNAYWAANGIKGGQHGAE